MRLFLNNENKLSVFIPKNIINRIDFDNKDSLEKYFYDFFLKLKDIYKLDIVGYYFIDIYVDNIYGVVIDITKEDTDCFDYFNNSIDMQISKPKETTFLYLISDLFFIKKDMLKKTNVYYYNNKYYLKCFDFKDKEFISLMDLVDDIIYDDLVNDIVKYGKLVMEV